jgi:hypothetical protein
MAGPATDALDVSVVGAGLFWNHHAAPEAAQTPSKAITAYFFL